MIFKLRSPLRSFLKNKLYENIFKQNELYHQRILRNFSVSHSQFSKTIQDCLEDGKINLNGKLYPIDHMTNVTPKILEYIGCNLHLKKHHPLSHLRQRIISYMYNRYLYPRGNPLFSIHDQISPIVTPNQCFDSLLIPSDHISRSKSDTYYLNSNSLLRTHTSAHQFELIKMGLDNFIVMGDVYRRDVIDKSHYPVFHQAEGVRLCSHKDIFKHLENSDKFELFQNGERTEKHQEYHTGLAIDILTNDLKSCLEGLALSLFGKDTQTRWVDEYFPFTHPSWELEVLLDGEWMEVLGCGIIEQEILHNGASDKVGWAFGLGLERLAMALYKIPDIRLFWSKDVSFEMQFKFDDPQKDVVFKNNSLSMNPLWFDLSFWLPENGSFTPTDFYDIVHNIGKGLIENVSLIDEFTHPKTKRKSFCFRLIYRHPEKQLSKEEVSEVHFTIAKLVEKDLGVTLRM